MTTAPLPPARWLGPLCLLLLASTVAEASDAREEPPPGASDRPHLDVVAAVPRDWPPYYLEGEEGRMTGFAIDVMDLVAERAGLNVRYHAVADFGDAIAHLKAGRADLIPNIGIAEQREPWMTFSAPVDTFDVRVFVRPGTREIQGAADLRGRPFAVVASNLGAHVLGDREEAVVYGDVRTALYEALGGQVDAVVYPEPVVLHLLKQAGLEERLLAVGPPVTEVKRGVAVRRDAPVLAARIRDAVDGLVGTPGFQAVYDRWMGAPTSWWTRERVAWLMGGVSVALLLLMAAWRYLSVLSLNRRLVETMREREEARRTLREREEQLQQAQRMEAIGRLAGGVAHDFNNILTVIVSSTKLALEDLPDDAPVREDLEEIVEAADRATALTRQLLAFSRRQVLDPAHVELDDLVEDAGRMVQRLVGEDIRVDVRTDARQAIVEADPAQLQRALLNLAANARDAMPDGGTLRISTRRVALDHDEATACSAGPHVALEVRDTGRGIEPEVLPHIFEPFFTTRAGHQGTGLGLAMVYGIVTQSGGCVRVDSAPGQGATFTVHLPVTDGTAATADPARPAASRPASDGGAILLAEDEGAVRRLAARALRTRGFEVLEAETGAEALERAASHDGSPLRLLVTDVVMPGMDGRTLAERLVIQRPELPVLFVSGYPADVELEEACRRPGRRFLPKPFSPDDLVRAVNALLREADEEGGSAPAAGGS
ncbi:MAG: ATP-binding protein [Myxococcota bacterium]